MSKDRSPSASRKARARRAHSGKRPWFRDPGLWLLGGLSVVVAIIVFSTVQGTVAANTVTATRSEDPADLLPLAQPVRPLAGTHEMARIPRQTPTPGPALGGPAPRMALPSVEYDFGTVRADQDVAHVFAIENRGNRDLIISNLVTSCGCTTARLSSSVIPGGQRADLTVLFDADYHDISGETVRLVWFATNDVTDPWVEVRIRADVQPVR